MSFSSDCKEELCRQPLGKSCCVFSELSALYMAAGSLNLLGSGQMSVQFTVESAAVAKRVFLLLQKLSLTAQVHSVTHPRFGGMKKWVLTMNPSQTPALLTRFSMMDLDHHGEAVLRAMSPKPSLNRQCCMRAFLRGSMLGSGSVTHPNRGYHLEISAPDETFRLSVSKCLQRFALPIRQSRRKGVERLYVTQGEQVANFLALIGAPQAVIKVEDSRVRGEVLGRVNRAMNCDAANLQKLMDASDKQMKEILKLISSDKFQTLPAALQEIALARMQAPDASFSELGQMLSPPVGKSGVNHRMRRLMEYAEETSLQASQKRRENHAESRTESQPHDPL